NLDSRSLEHYSVKYQNIVNMYRTMAEKDINDLIIVSPKQKIHRDIMNIFDPAIIHLMRNAIDHGIEDNETRQALKKGAGQISIDFRYKNDKYEFIVKDNGKGINPNSIYETALEKKLINEKDTKNLSDQEKIKLICLPGFSTKKVVTQTSGRGVGMDAVIKSMQLFGGGFEIGSTLGKGTTFTIWLPGKAHILNYQKLSRSKTNLWNKILEKFAKYQSNLGKTS
ncbi:ATP-binding protein, partial [Candidatus Margulisiibacteriota bacterium]